MSEVSIYLGFDPREADAFAVAKSSIRRHVPWAISVRGLVLSDLRERGLYSRPTSRREGRLWDDLSDAPMSTEFACSRFLVPFLANGGWCAIFMDSDMLVRARIDRVIELLDRDKAVTVVKHRFDPPEGLKMDGQAQTRYARKNWSSFMVWNLAHPANRRLTLEMVNTLPGRDLHRFCWLEDNEIGELGPEWNWLVGHSDPSVDPKVVHFTEGLPSMAGHENDPYADEWRAELYRWAA